MGERVDEFVKKNILKQLKVKVQCIRSKTSKLLSSFINLMCDIVEVD